MLYWPGGLLTAALLALAVPSWGAVYHVAPNGSDRAPGTAAQPYATIGYAINTLKAGDELLVHGGVYAITAPIRPRVSGTAGAWITVAAAPGQTPVIDAAGMLQAPDGTPISRRAVGAIQVQDVSYLRFEGLHVRESHAVGIMVTRNAEHIDVLHCVVDHTYAPGIFLYQHPKYLRVIGCELTRTNDLAMRDPGEPLRREAPHEALSIAGAEYFEIADNRVHGCHKEGIDCKETSKHGVIHDNEVYDMPRQGLYVDAWFGELSDVELYGNYVHNCEWGVAISVEGRGAHMDDVRIHHNVLAHNRASGIFFGVWGQNGPRKDVYIYNNTVYGNGRPKHWAGATGGIDVRSTNLSDVWIVNNIVWDNACFEISTFAAPDEAARLLAEKHIVIENNLTSRFHDESSGDGGIFNPTWAYRGIGSIVADPQFVDAPKGDFALEPGSPARGAAKALVPFATGPDLGASSAWQGKATATAPANAGR